MSSHQSTMIEQHPISFEGYHKSDVRTQFAGLCYKIRKKKIEVLLITSRSTKRWIVPKGWPMEGQTPAECAAIEAWEEAGVNTKSDGRCIGVFSYNKDTVDLGEFPCLAMVFALEVYKQAKTYPECKERKRKWMTRKKAAKLVSEPELSRIIRDFDPRVVS